MLKFAFITDPHFGVRANSDIFLNNIRDYLYTEFIPALKENKITHVFIGGDVFDARQAVNIKTFNYVFDFFKKMSDEGFKVFVIAGNHDLYLSTSNDYTSLSFLSNFPNVTFVRSGFQEVDIEGTKIALMPWIPDHKAFVTDPMGLDFLLKYNKCKVCIGHFQFIGFKMNKTKIMEEGMPDVVMTKMFSTIISGHYHMRSEKDTNGAKIIYPGTPYQLTRADTGDERGFCIFTFDGDKLVDYKYVNNKHAIRFESIVYPEEFKEEQIRGNIIDILVDYSEKFDEVKLDEYKAKVESFGPAYKPEIRLVNKEQQGIKIELSDFASKTTIDLMNEYIEGIQIEEKERVREEIISLYNQVKVSE